MKFDFTFKYKLAEGYIREYGVIITSLKYETFKLYVRYHNEEHFKLDSTPNIIHVRCLGKEWSNAFLREYGLYLIENTILTNEERS